MFSLKHSFNSLSFLNLPHTNFDKHIDEIKEFVEYKLSAQHISTDSALFRSILSAEDDILHLSVMHELLEDGSFSLEDVVDILILTPIDNVTVLGRMHFHLNYRLHTLYWAIVLSVHKTLERHSDRVEPYPWVSLSTLATDPGMITTNLELITKALSSGVPSKLEATHDVGNNMLVRIIMPQHGFLRQ